MAAAELSGNALIRKLYPERPGWCRKGDYGRLLVVAGSRNFSGPTVLCSLAALRSGVDLVVLATPESSAHAPSHYPDIMTHPLGGERLSTSHIKELLSLAAGCDAVLMGGGLGRDGGTKKAILSFLRSVHVPCAIDADAIRAVSGEGMLRKSFVVTPHTNEFLGLTGENPEKSVEERKRLAMLYAGKLQTNILLKGHVDVVTDGSRVFLNSTGSPYMTKGGTGETLAGICGALLAMKHDPFEAACAAAHINGLAGSLAAKKYGPGLLASDLLAEIPNAIRPR
jgi:hydroxyethylthiazole kinase-like uncharacterized protein yjeF